MIGEGSHSDPWDAETREWVERTYAAEKERKNMNLECKLPTKTPFAILASINAGLNDMEYWSPCELSGLLARNWIKRVEAPFGGYYLELTEDGLKELDK